MVADPVYGTCETCERLVGLTADGKVRPHRFGGARCSGTTNKPRHRSAFA